jgi:DNA-binding NarL/FixJ family response regulator
MSTDGRAGAERRRPITVVLVDEDWMVRRLVAETLSGAGLQVVGEATNGQDAIEVVLDVRPDVVLIAIELPGISGVKAIQRLGVLTPACRMLVLTSAEQNRVVEAIVAGASGYILKSAPPQEIIAAVRATAAAESVLSPASRRQAPRAHPPTAHPHHHKRGRRRHRDPRRANRTRAGDLHPPGQRQQRQTNRTTTVAKHKHRLKPRQEHPRQTPTRKPHPSRRPSNPRRHLLTPPAPPRCGHRHYCSRGRHINTSSTENL